MHGCRILATAALAALFSSGCQPSGEESAPPMEETAETSMSDEDLLEAQTDAFEEHWSKADAAGLAGLFVEDGDNVGPDGAHFRGRAAIQKRYEDLFAGPYQGTTVDIEQESVKMVSEDTAIVNGTYEIQGVESADGSAVPVKGAYTNLAVKQGGAWMLHSVRAMLSASIPGQ